MGSEKPSFDSVASKCVSDSCDCCDALHFLIFFISGSQSSVSLGSFFLSVGLFLEVIQCQNQSIRVMVFTLVLAHDLKKKTQMKN